MKMEKLVAEFPKNIADALEIAAASNFNNLNRTFTSVVIIGMGGSGIGGKLVAQLVAEEATTPIVSVQDYDLPSFVNEHTLVIASSYSGNTEETMIALEVAEKKGATLVAITSGGDLYADFKKKGFDVVKVPGGNPPRTALAFSVVQLLNILTEANIISSEKLEQVKKCRALLNDKLIQIKNKAKELAEFAYKGQLIIYASSNFEAVAVRTRQQWNENAKTLCWHHVIPEMNHNELVGWGGGNDTYCPLFLDSKFINDRNRKRFELSQEIVGAKTKHIFNLLPEGKNVVEESFYLIHLVDWASVYLAGIKNQDPVEIKVIDYLKDELSKF